MKKFNIKEDDVINIDKYINERPKIKKEISEIKKFRRIPVGPYATFYFECYDNSGLHVKTVSEGVFYRVPINTED